VEERDKRRGEDGSKSHQQSREGGAEIGGSSERDTWTVGRLKSWRSVRLKFLQQKTNDGDGKSRKDPKKYLLRSVPVVGLQRAVSFIVEIAS